MNEPTEKQRYGGEGLSRGGPFEKKLALALSLVAIGYAFLAGLRTVTDYDLGWQLATGRWVAEHHQIPSVDVFSYTAAGQPWIYPLGSGLIFYATYLLGNFALLSGLGALACTGTVVLLLWHRPAVTAGLVIFAIPLIAVRTTPRAEMFTVLLFTAFLTSLWRFHEGRRVPLWHLPLLMVLWVNLHLGFVAGIALLGGYTLVEALAMIWPAERPQALERLRLFAPWMLVTLAATLVNPWGWRVYGAVWRQQLAMVQHSQSISEWAATPLNWVNFSSSISLRSAEGAFFLLLAVVLVALPLAGWRRQPGAAVLLAAAALLGARHARLQVFFALVAVVVAGALLESASSVWQEMAGDARFRVILAGAGSVAVLLACVRSADVVTNRTYLEATSVASFGTGLSWWFPEAGAAFIQRENIPGQVFNDYNEGGYLTWRLGPRYLDYIDGRAIPFGPGLLERSRQLMATAPESAEWQQEAERYDINVILVPLGRYDAVQFFPVLRQFCASPVWRPVYLDEVSAVFVRRRPQTESLLEDFALDCATAPLPRQSPEGGGARAFNQWANAAAVLHALGRNPEAFAASAHAMHIFPDCAFVHFLRGTLLEQLGDDQSAEQEYRVAADLQPSAVAPWATLAAFYRQRGRLPQAVAAGEHGAALSPRPWSILLELGYSYAQLHQPQAALRAFDRALDSLPHESSRVVDNSFLASVARGRALSWDALGNLPRAIGFEEEAVRLVPDSSGQWLELASLYESAGRIPEAQQARLRAARLSNQGQRLSRQQ